MKERAAARAARAALEQDMTLRDWLAGQFLAGRGATFGHYAPVDRNGRLVPPADAMAQEAYAVADAMLRARQRKGEA